MHSIFKCALMKEVWQHPGLLLIMEEAARVDRLSSVVLQSIICSSSSVLAMPGIGLAELVLTGAWFIW